jgi:DNA-binding transcriptional MerR regulator
MYTIGEFSRVTRISIKALRHYDEIGLLVPVRRDELNNYRFYNDQQIEPAILISELKELGFSLDEIKLLLHKIDYEKNILTFLESQKEKISGEIENAKARIEKIEVIIKEKKGITMKNLDLTVQEKNIPDMLIAGIRHQGHYKEIGPLFGKLVRACGPKICGPAFALYYDEGYKEEGADFEAAVPIKSKIDKEGIAVRELKGGKALTIIHKGPYEAIGNTYKKIIDYMKKKQITSKAPSREVYLKGPGLIFRNPKKYITEIQFLVGKE